MEAAAAIALQQPIRFPNVAAAAAASSSAKELGNSSGKFVQLRRWRAKNRVLSSGFCDRAHLQYYKSSFASAASTAEDAEVKAVPGRRTSGKGVKKMKKKQLKLLKGLKLLDHMNGNMITEATQAEGKEAKRRMKEEKARSNCEVSSSSSSSESSDSECGKVVVMSSLKRAKEETFIIDAAPAPVSLLKKIEVCMGGKCKKSGAGALLEELKRVVGIEDAVSGCKCMGRCRDGPNVKLVGPAAANSLCIGVGLEDVNVIMAKFIDEHQQQQLGFGGAS